MEVDVTDFFEYVKESMKEETATGDYPLVTTVESMSIVMREAAYLKLGKQHNAAKKGDRNGKDRKANGPGKGQD